jgi:hypothetical protein
MLYFSQKRNKKRKWMSIYPHSKPLGNRFVKKKTVREIVSGECNNKKSNQFEISGSGTRDQSLLFAS